MADCRYFKNLEIKISPQFPCETFQNLKNFQQASIDILNYLSVIKQQI